MKRLYNVTRVWYIEAESASEAIEKSHNWNHDATYAKLDIDEERYELDSNEEPIKLSRWERIRNRIRNIAAAAVV